LVALLGAASPIPVTYAGGVRDMADLERVRALGGGRVDITVGSALDIFGGALNYSEVVAWSKAQEAAAAATAAAPAAAAASSASGSGAAAPAGSGSGSSSGSSAGASVAGSSGVGISHDAAARKFYVVAPSGEEARLTYTLNTTTAGMSQAGGGEPATVMDMRSTFVPDAFRGQGMAAKLAAAAFAHAAAAGYRVQPTCSYIRDNFVPKNPQYAGLIARM
jgi:predicted GNAT family acetyltransferase